MKLYRLRFATVFRVRKLFGTFEKQAPGFESKSKSSDFLDCIKMFFAAFVLCSLIIQKANINSKPHRSYKTQIAIPGFEQPGPGAPLLGLAKSTYQN